MDTWFSALGISGATYKIIDTRVGTINGSTLTTTNWGKTQVTATSGNNFRVLILEVRPKGAVAMPMVKGGYTSYGLALKADGTVWKIDENAVPYQYSGGNTGSKYLENIIEIESGSGLYFALGADGRLWAWGYDNNSGGLGLGAGITNLYAPTRVGTASNIVHVARGMAVLAYIDTTGDVYMSGNGGYGQLGVGTYGKYYTPQRVLVNNIIEVRLNSWTSTSYLDCWGRVWQAGWNMGGTAIAPGSSSSNNGMSAYPIMVPTTYLSHIVEIESVGNMENTTRWALNADGDLFRWAYSNSVSSGEVPATGIATTIVKYNKISDVIHIMGTAGRNTDSYIVMSAQKRDGTIYTWGYSQRGSLGTGGALSRYQPEPTAVNLTNVAQYDSMFYFHNFAVVRYDGSVYAWGGNDFAQLGDGTKTDRAVPVRSGGDGTEMLSAEHATVTGGATQIHYDETNPLPSTITIAENETLTIDIGKITKGISGGFWLIEPELIPVTGDLAIDSTDKKIATIGRQNIGSGYVTIDPNQNKVYGETTITIRETTTGMLTMLRVRVKPKDTVAMPMVTCGQARVTALKANGTVWSWGRNTTGDAGNGVTASPKDYIDEPVQVVLQDSSPLDNVVQIAAGASTTYALKADGTVWSWGDNTYNQIGIGGVTDLTKVIPYAVQVEAGQQISADGYFHNVIRIAAGQYSGYAITNTGEAFAWGNGSNGELGCGDRSNYGRPHYVLRVTNILDITAQFGSAMFLRNNGTVFICGTSNLYFGNGYNQTNIPMQVYAGNTDSQSGYVENIVEIAATGYCDSGNNPVFYHLSADGKVYAQGYGEANSLGLGDGTTYGQPQKVEGFDEEKVIHIAATGSYNEKTFGGAAITESGKTYTWGGTDNSKGQLGNGTFVTLHPTPRLTTDKAFNLITIDGARHTGYVGTTQDGAVRGWGGNWYAQLGYKSLEDKSKAIIAHGLYTNIQVNDAAVYRGSSAAAAYGADAGAAGTQCPGEIWLSATPQGSSGVHGRRKAA